MGGPHRRFGKTFDAKAVRLAGTSGHTQPEVAKNLGIGLSTLRRRLDKRHSHAVRMLAAGVHPKMASERPGHPATGVTPGLSPHVPPGMGADAAEPVDAAIQRAVKPKA